MVSYLGVESTKWAVNARHIFAFRRRGGLLDTLSTKDPSRGLVDMKWICVATKESASGYIFRNEEEVGECAVSIVCYAKQFL